MSRPHDDLVNAIMLYISSIGGCCTKVDTPGLLFSRDGKPVKIGTKGVLDIEATIKGRSVKIDAKVGKDRMRTEQINFARAVERAGGVAFAARSVADVEMRLKEEGLA
jgi:hypothetical protein